MKSICGFSLILAAVVLAIVSFRVYSELSAEDFTGQKYLLLRDAFIKQGWLPDTEHADPKVYPEFPEISCGSGKDAICSAGFKLGSRYEAVVIEVKSSELIVAGSY